MKAISWSFIVLPTVLLPLVLMLSENDIGNGIGYVFAWLWILSSIGCVVWGFYIMRRYRGLARACLAVGFLHVALVVLLPLLARAKMRTSLDAPVPNKSLQATQDGRSSSAVAEHVIRPACLSSGR